MKNKWGITKQNIIVTAIVAFLVIISNYLGHVTPPFSISFTPFLLGISSFLVFIFSDYRLEYKYIIVTAIVILNDMLIKTFAGGASDLEGLGWIHALLFIGLIISLIIIIVYLFIHKNKVRSSLYLGCSTVLLFLYLSYFNTFGTNLNQFPLEEKSAAKQNGLFLYPVKFSDSYFVSDNDTIRLTDGWVQKEIRLNHLGLLKKIENTDNNIFLFRLSGKTGPKESGMIYYKMSDEQSGGPVIRSGINSIRVKKSKKKFYIAFYLNSKMLKNVWIEPADK